MTSRRLILLRHAKSDWHDASLGDHARPLNPRGQRDAPLMGRRLRKRDVRPELILSSDALRAISTAEHVAKEISYPVSQIQTEHSLYLAEAKAILDIIARVSRSFTQLMIVGHNPGLTDLANQISEATIDNLPTCSMFAVDFEADSWTDLARGSGQLAWFDYPKQQ